jgi:SOS response associated peptidase (SRAP)
MRWGLIPAWWVKSLKKIPATSTPAGNPSPTSRCFAMPFGPSAASFRRAASYEWTGDKGDKQPHLFTAADGSPILAFAGLWDRWRDRETGEHGTVTRTKFCRVNIEVSAQVQAAVAARQVRNASSLRTRSVRRDVRWRWTLNVFWTAA